MKAPVKKANSKKEPRSGKNIIKSKTFWANVVLVLLIPFAPPALKEYLKDPEIVAALFTLANVLLRLASSDKVYLK